MESNTLALAVILISAGAGLLVSTSTGFDASTVFHAADDKPAPEQDEGFVYGSTHEHALLYVVVNGSEMDFLEPRYQLASNYVHLENNNSHIVHKHAEGVTWNYFFDTLNMTVERDGNQACIERNDETRCGPAVLELNGESFELSSEITQGDRLIIALGENASEAVEEYSSRQLPPAYKPQESRGRRV